MIQTVRQILSLFSKKVRYKLLVLFGLMVIAASLEVVGLGMIPVFVTTIASPEKLFDYPVIGDWVQSLGINSSEQLILYGGILLIIIFLIKNIYLTVFSYLKQRFVESRGVELQGMLFKCYLLAPYTFHTNRNSAELLRNVETEVNKIIDGMLLPLLELALNILMFVFIVGTLLYFEPAITILAIGVVGGFGFLFLKYTRTKTSEYGTDRLDASSEKNKIILQGLHGLSEIRLLKREPIFLNQYYKSAEKNKRANVYLSVVGKVPKYIIESLSVTGMLLIAFFMIWQGRDTQSIIPILALFGAAMIRLMPIFNQVINQITKIRYNAPSVNTVYNDIEELKDRLEAPDTPVEKTLRLEQQLILENISYRYPGAQQPSIQNVSLRIEKGNVVAFVGPTGAGKTTLINIILGLLHPDSGSIKIDDTDILNRIEEWQMNVGYVPQSIYLLDDTIRQNIALGLPDREIDEQKLWDAIEAAQLDDFIIQLDKGLHTVVGERGVRLSGGQKQRIGIARALYNNPDVLVLDEATSSLDNLTEKHVMDAIRELRGEKTIILIAHRLSTVEACDKLFMLEDGIIVDRGSYDYLARECNAFKQMSLHE